MEYGLRVVALRTISDECLCVFMCRSCTFILRSNQHWIGHMLYFIYPGCVMVLDNKVETISSPLCTTLPHLFCVSTAAFNVFKGVTPPPSVPTKKPRQLFRSQRKTELTRPENHDKKGMPNIHQSLRLCCFSCTNFLL